MFISLHLPFLLTSMHSCLNTIARRWQTCNSVRVNDVVKVDLATGKMTEIIKFETGATCVVTKGKNNGRMGTITSRDKHPGGFDIINVKDSKGKAFATRI